MRLSATDDIETGLVDLSGRGFHEVMALNDPEVVQAQATLLRQLAHHAHGLRGGNGEGSPYFVAGAPDRSDPAEEPVEESAEESAVPPAGDTPPGPASC